MSYERIKIGQSVIISNNKSLQVAIVLDRKIREGKRVFTVKTETGFEIPYVALDKFTDKIYIDTVKTNRIANKIETNLSLDTDNLRKK